MTHELPQIFALFWPSHKTDEARYAGGYGSGSTNVIYGLIRPFSLVFALQVYPMKVILSGLETMTVTRGNRDLAVPRNTTLLLLPPFAPELNPNKNPL
jgi:hypothetical protein